jgi:hypothetical protein
LVAGITGIPLNSASRRLMRLAAYDLLSAAVKPMEDSYIDVPTT